jgi:hypothetical protein
MFTSENNKWHKYNLFSSVIVISIFSITRLHNLFHKISRILGSSLNLNYIYVVLIFRSKAVKIKYACCTFRL